MKALFFEDPFWLYGFLLVAEAALAARWWRTRERRHALWLLFPLGLAAVLVALSTLVVTDREKIKEATSEIIAHVQARRIEAIEAHLDEDFRVSFQGRGMDRAEALRELGQALSRGGVGEVVIKENEVEVKGPEARQRLLTLIELRGGFGNGRLPVHWQLHWVRVGGRWRIHEVAEPRIGVTP
ncbi:MAG: nuclear transport factor 2 family protein [Polyangia bacterium]|jgi:hypothetical protein|nr:nuclear transport factor 2 family protein [Polyangia bacterium]